MGSIRYDEDGRIRDSKNKYISNTDIIELVENAMTQKRILIGQDEFIDLLLESNIDPDLILNDQVKSKLYEKLDDRPPLLERQDNTNNTNWEIPDDDE